ncbi:MAG: 4-hydroxythreonine-4-phosphate dehydrogenase PdxA [Candidatus Dadabacteria bacterium]|nr:MAG: 4-hydroxythreonine-4-phosphate dehydrogenase PdxA [Candidatus Dadabacteria bacterium]
MGDPAGVGPDVVVAAAWSPRVRRACSMRVFGDRRVLESTPAWRGRIDGSAIERIEEVTALRWRGPRPRPGRRCGEAAFRYLEQAVAAVRRGECDALVTAPLNKFWMNRAGHPYDGHTGYLSHVSGCRAVMMLAGRRLRVVLVTAHVAHRSVSELLDVGSIVHAGRTTEAHLRRYHGVDRPRLAVAALNPHGGEGGLFGDEERRVIRPAVRLLRRRGVSAEGPLPADTLFAAAVSGDYDAVICMYHDQALIPLKMLEFGRAVNVSMGLPFIRTSPDHGTAYELAGTGAARADSMEESLVLAAMMARRLRGRVA